MLVVDDCASERRTLLHMLRGWGYDVAEAGSGAEALEICDGTEIDLVLSDWIMPGMTGAELARGFRQVERETYGYFILLTTKSDAGDETLGYECGADDFISKPVDPQDLGARLHVAERIVRMHRDLADKNRLLTEALDELQDLHEALDSDLEDARRLQTSLVPDRALAVAGGQVTMALRAAGHVGGDLVGLLPATPGSVGLYSVDVSGHGIAAALLAARIDTWLTGATADRSIALESGRAGQPRLRSPEAICSRLHRLLMDEVETGHFATACVVAFDPPSGRVRCALAGHPQPLVIGQDGRTRRLGRPGQPLGLLEDPLISIFEAELAHGERLLLHSDGLVDALGSAAGEAALDRLVSRQASMVVGDLLEAVIWAVQERSGAGALPDDISAIMLERRA